MSPGNIQKMLIVFYRVVLVISTCASSQKIFTTKPATAVAHRQAVPVGTSMINFRQKETNESVAEAHLPPINAISVHSIGVRCKASSSSCLLNRRLACKYTSAARSSAGKEITT
jgi:hypothetical protein